MSAPHRASNRPTDEQPESVSEGKPLRKPIQGSRLEQREHLAGHRRPAAGADEPREPGGRPRNRDPRRQREVRAHVGSVPRFKG